DCVVRRRALPTYRATGAGGRKFETIECRDARERQLRRFSSDAGRDLEGQALRSETRATVSQYLGAANARPSRLMCRNASEMRVTFVFSERDNYGNKKTFKRRHFPGNFTSR